MRTHSVAILALLALGACKDEASVDHLGAVPPRPKGLVIEIRDTTIPALLEASGVAEPMQQATLSTRLAGAITSVPVQEGQVVTAGQVLARVDARDLAAKQEQAAAGVAQSEAVLVDARVQATRYRALFADSAAPKAQLDAAETGLARAEAAAQMTRGSAAELEVMAGYAEVRSPFAGTVTRRMVDPGDFVAPGVPIVMVEDQSRLRIVVTLAPREAAGLRSGSPIAARIEGSPADATIEGIVAAGPGLLHINAIVENKNRRFPSGGAARLLVPQGNRSAIVLPAAAIVTQGDLTGVRLETSSGFELRWVRLGTRVGDLIEVLSGIRSGDRVLVPDPVEGNR